MPLPGSALLHNRPERHRGGGKYIITNRILAIREEQGLSGKINHTTNKYHQY